MRFFTPAWYMGDDAPDDEAQSDAAFAAYQQHRDRIAAQLPPPAYALARHINLHDGLIRAARLQRSTATLDLRLRCGDLQAGYFDLDITYQGVHLSPEALAHLAARVNDDQTEILYDEIDLHGAGAYIHRLLLWPLSEIAIPFAALTFAKRPTPNREFVATSPVFKLAQ